MMKTNYIQPQTLVVMTCPELMKIPGSTPPGPAAPQRGEGSSVKLTKMYI